MVRPNQTRVKFVVVAEKIVFDPCFKFQIFHALFWLEERSWLARLLANYFFPSFADKTLELAGMDKLIS